MRLNRQLIHIKAHYYLALLIAFSLPIARLTPVFIALMLINWLLEADFKNKFQILFKNKIACLFISFYLLHLIGLLYTENVPAGLFDIQVKLSLLIFPVVIISRPFNEKQVNAIFYSFIAGGIIASIAMLVRAVYLYYTLGENNFFYEAFSFILHPSYLSMYLNVAIAWMLINLLQHKMKERYYKLYAFLVIVFFSFVIILLSSKMGLITMILMYACFFIYYILVHKKYLLGISGIVMIAVMIFFITRFVPEVVLRVQTAVAAVTAGNSSQTESESTAVRLLIWKASNQVISENLLFGVGTGDVKEELMKEYKRRGMTGAIEYSLNTHNAFYQVFVGLGLIGFSFLLLQLFIPLFFAYKKSNSIYLLFLLIVLLNFSVEAMLETQAGVMFYAFFNSLLFCNKSMFSKELSGKIVLI